MTSREAKMGREGNEAQMNKPNDQMQAKSQTLLNQTGHNLKVKCERITENKMMVYVFIKCSHTNRLPIIIINP